MSDPAAALRELAALVRPHRVCQQAAQLGDRPPQPEQAAHTSAKAAAAASSVRVTWSGPWASDGNHASNWDGGG